MDVGHDWVCDDHQGEPLIVHLDCRDGAVHRLGLCRACGEFPCLDCERDVACPTPAPDPPATVWEFLWARVAERQRACQAMVDHLTAGGERGFDFYQLPPPVNRWMHLSLLPAVARPQIDMTAELVDLAEKLTASSSQTDRAHGLRLLDILVGPHVEHPDWNLAWQARP